MNKKVSTLLTMGLFLGGSLFNVVNAEELYKFMKGGETPTSAVKLENGKSYFLQMNNHYLHSEINNKNFNYSLVDNGENIDKDELKEYLWTVTIVEQADATKAYKFKNAESGKEIYFTLSNDAWVLDQSTEVADKAVTQNTFCWVDGKGNVLDQSTDESGFKSALLKAYKKNGKPTAEYYLGVENNSVLASTVGTEINMIQLADGIDVDVANLNKLYNSVGFNFELNDDKLADVANIFGDKRVVALNVDGEASKKGSSKFPKGTYFATSVPYLWDYEYDNGEPTNYPSYDYLVQCTFIAVDSDNNISDDADVQKAGNEFTLTEVSGKDLVVYDGEDETKFSKGNQIAAKNACFTVKESTTADNYKLTVTFRALEKAGGDQKEFTKDIVANAKKASIYTGDTDASANFIFKFAESTVEKGISFLKEDGASIYNIKFYLKNGKDDSYNGKYLTTNPKGNACIAYGKVLADLDAPAYQWVISDVDGNDVTFTNRENGYTLVTKLFKEADGRYSLAPVNTDAVFTYYNVADDGDVEEGGTRAFQGVYVELESSNAVNYSDYLNVEDKTVMTLSFGRDIAPTSNKLYPIVTEVAEGNYKFCDDTEEHYNLTDDISKAAQWLLVKTRNANDVIVADSKVYNYAYANGDLVNIKNNGDVVYAYTYKLQLVLDGKVIDRYLEVGDETGYTDNGYKLGVNGDKFFIQENEDGSVLLKTARNADKAMYLSDYQSEKTINQLIKEGFKPDDIKITSFADDVKTFLIAEAPAVSLPANEGHYSIATELGNYITMNEERDGLTVKEESEPLYLYVTDTKEVTPSFYVTKAAKNKEERMFLFNPQDSVNYYVADGQYKKEYQYNDMTKAIFKAASINATRDTLTTSIKGQTTLVANKSNNTEKVNGGLGSFKMQIVENPDAEGMYVIRNLKEHSWLTALNGMLIWTGDKKLAQNFTVEGAEAPTSNESVAASEVKVIANNGSINVKNAAGKNVVVSTILGQVVANEVLTSDNATINVPAGIVVVAVEGESFKVNVK